MWSPSLVSLALAVVELVLVVLLTKGQLGAVLAGWLVPVLVLVLIPLPVPGVARMVRLPPSIL